MNPKSQNTHRRRKWFIAIALALVVVAVCGCQTLGYYKQAIKGQYELLAHQQPIQKLLLAPQTPAPLRQKLQLVEELRAFAQEKLKLPVNGHYLKYVDVHRPFAVWNVEAAPEFSLEAKAWWYPLVGSLEYRGYFSERAAREYGGRLQRKGYDVFVGGVQAYSTLGWFRDPVLNTFIFDAEADLAETIFHELAHQRVFAHGDTDFNEAFATTVGQEGARRWLRARADARACQNYLDQLGRTQQFVRLIMETRQRLATLYGDERADGSKARATNKKRGVAPEELRRQKKYIMERLQQDYQQLKARWGGQSEYDEWFTHTINNAQLNSVAAYYDFMPGFEKLLASNGGDLESFYQAAKGLAKKPKKKRDQCLSSLSRDEQPEAKGGQ